MKHALHGHVSSSKCTLHRHISRFRNSAYTAEFRRSKSPLHETISTLEICPTRIYFEASKFCLHGKISNRNMSCTDTFRGLEFWRIQDSISKFSSKSPLHEVISRKSRISDSIRVKSLEFASTRDEFEERRKARNGSRVPVRARNLPYTGKFRQKFALRIFDSEKSQCDFSEFQNSEIQNFEILVNWGRIGVTMVLNFANFRIFRNLNENSNFERGFEIERRKGNIDPSNFKNFLAPLRVILL